MSRINANQLSGANLCNYSKETFLTWRFAKENSSLRSKPHELKRNPSTTQYLGSNSSSPFNLCSQKEAAAAAAAVAEEEEEEEKEEKRFFDSTDG